MTRAHHRIQLRVTGRVQGVFYRVSTRETAANLGLTGWVRNLPDGSVEALAEGPKSALESLAGWCKEGPAWARVEEVHTIWSNATGEFADFRVR